MLKKWILFCKRQFWSNNVPNYGNCYTFNTYLSEDDLGGTRVASLTGPDFGLSLILNIEQTNYMANSLSRFVSKIRLSLKSFLPLATAYGL